MLTKQEIDALQKILMNYYQGRVSIAAEAVTIERLSNKLNQLNQLLELPKPKEPEPTKPEEVGDGSTQG
jgi:hypothetical protein